MYALKDCDKEDESDVTFRAFCPSTLLSWSASGPLESSGSAARNGNFFFVFDCYVSNKRTLYLYFIVTLAMRARSVLYLIVTLVMSAHYILYFIVTLVMSERSVLYLIVTL